MTLNVVPKVSEPEELLPTFTDDMEDVNADAITEETFNDIFNDKSVNITMDTVGRTAIYEGDDYVAKINLKQLPVSNDAGAIDVSLFDENNKVVYNKSKNFPTKYSEE